jgi:hypothetical protein
MALESIGMSGAGVVASAAAGGGYGLLGVLKGVNMNITTDNTVPLQANSFILRRIVMTNASISLTTAAGGIYTAAAKGGTAVVAAAQVYATLTAPSVSLDLTIAAAGLNVVLSGTSLFLNLTTAQGAAATADLYIYGERIS